MTKESPMTNAETSAHAAASSSSLVIRVLATVIRIYQLIISPAQTFLFGPTAGCRFTPSCSQYAIDVIRSRGAISGSWLAARRICRCHPFGSCGHDPVPQKNLQPSAN